MTKTVNVAEAKAGLSRLLDEAANGLEVVIARAGKPVARLVPVVGPAPRQLGFLPGIHVDDAVFDPLDDDELAGWE